MPYNRTPVYFFLGKWHFSHFCCENNDRHEGGTGCMWVVRLPSLCSTSVDSCIGKYISMRGFGTLGFFDDFLSPSSFWLGGSFFRKGAFCRLISLGELLKVRFRSMPRGILTLREVALPLSVFDFWSSSVWAFIPFFTSERISDLERKIFILPLFPDLTFFKIS